MEGKPEHLKKVQSRTLSHFLNKAEGRVYSHETNPTFQVHCQILDGEVELIQGRLHVGHRQAQVTQVSREDALTTQEVPGEGQQQVLTSL